ncbi:MAG: TIGR03854 family LLM class F420-dependent oxidoreductase, partial [Acidimicrobiales bacterium]
ALCTPADAAAGRVVVDEAAAAVGRSISREHFGVSIGYADGSLDGAVRRAIESRSRGRPADELVPVGLDQLRARMEEFIDVGFSKFVVRPLRPPADWTTELKALAGAVGDLQT